MNPQSQPEAKTSWRRENHRRYLTEGTGGSLCEASCVMQMFRKQCSE